jgi:hypothetical protein
LLELQTVLLRELLTGDTREANSYREQIREYSSAMAFATMGVEIKSSPEIVHTTSGYTARFSIRYHCRIQTKQISQDIDNFIFSILLKQQQSGLKTNPRVYGRNKATIE